MTIRPHIEYGAADTLVAFARLKIFRRIFKASDTDNYS
ncbi:hypothetical protein B0H03_10937 [Rathayibacter iranicus NCPPB 2253 = VKM Ac-1602]|uniref:Uncharacterized protein n=1 Tax=Rathayibacter iranicus NCPPB 2253 = VKM Ac-1602 TaxID=1328868 RepID=A0ABX5LE73_9MICO|nr:hypothetical protein B0H03_10937 [Rathayibacter iranicus NCPPB 2253 = VKM Ac-1602]